MRPWRSGPRALDLHDLDAVGEQELAQAGAEAAGALDPDHDLVAELAQPLRKFQVAGEAGLDLQAAHQLPEPVERPGQVLVLVGVHAHCDHRLLLIVDLGDVEAVGQCCVERCQASMKSRRHPVQRRRETSLLHGTTWPTLSRAIPPPAAPSPRRRTPPGRLPLALRARYEGDRPTAPHEPASATTLHSTLDLRSWSSS
jgi:hypothetical protein